MVPEAFVTRRPIVAGRGVSLMKFSCKESIFHVGSLYLPRVSLQCNLYRIHLPYDFPAIHLPRETFGPSGPSRLLLRLRSFSPEPSRFPALLHSSPSSPAQLPSGFLRARCASQPRLPRPYKPPPTKKALICKSAKELSVVLQFGVGQVSCLEGVQGGGGEET